jgi:hypothetical protein
MKERFSKVSRRMWNDERFRRLSSAPPNGQTLWQRLLTGPELSVIPGAFQAWEGGLAQALGWPLEAFREAFAEVSREGMAEADWAVGFVWVPKAIRHNVPESPNVVRGWAATWSELPECELKLTAYHGLKAFIEGLHEAFAEAFAQACPKPSRKPCPNQEQEQEQEQEGVQGGALQAEPPPTKPKAPKRGSKTPAAQPHELSVDFVPDPDHVTALATKWSISQQQVRATVADFVWYWTRGRGKGKRRTDRGWEQAFGNRIDMLAKEERLPPPGGVFPAPTQEVPEWQ